MVTVNALLVLRFVSGLARLVSAAATGWPGPIRRCYFAIELFVVPLIMSAHNNRLTSQRQVPRSVGSNRPVPGA